MSQEDQKKNGKFLKKIRRKTESLLHKFQVNTMDNMEKVMKQPKETIQQSVRFQLQGMNTTIEK